MHAAVVMKAELPRAGAGRELSKDMRDKGVRKLIRCGYEILVSTRGRKAGLP